MGGVGTEAISRSYERCRVLLSPSGHKTIHGLKRKGAGGTRWAKTIKQFKKRFKITAISSGKMQFGKILIQT